MVLSFMVFPFKRCGRARANQGPEPMPAPPLWKASIALEKTRAPDMASLLELASDPQAVLIVEEPFGPGAVVEALYTDEPDAALS